MEWRDSLTGIAGRKIVLVGGAGFIGHNLALALKGLGADVRVLDGLLVNNLLSFAGVMGDNLPNRDLYLHILDQRFRLLREQDIPLHVMDCRDYNLMQRWMEDIRPEVIVHLAAVSHANRSNKDPHSTFDHSLRTLENALDCAKVNGAEHFIFFSSSMVYGNFASEAVTEDAPCDPLGIYGALKFGGEKLVIAYNQVFDLPYTIVRPSALYGERCVSRRVGQIFIENSLTGLEIVIAGDGEDRLDFTYIDDLVQGIARAIDHPDARNQTFNLTYGESRSLNQMVEVLKDHFPGVSVRYQPKDKLTPDRGTLCVDKAREMIGYDPQYPLEKGFPKYIEWYKQLFANYSNCKGALSIVT